MFCHEACRLNNNTAECFCQAGYTVNTTNSSACDDEDECSTFSPCTQICENTEGSFRCDCHSGYSLDEDGVTCSPCTGLTYGPGFVWIAFVAGSTSVCVCPCVFVPVCLSVCLSVCQSVSLSLSLSLSLSYRLAGLVVKASASGAEDPGFESHLQRDFSGWSHASDFKIGTPVATLPGAWRYEVSDGTGRPGVSIL